jgi:hypothetical protein
MLKNMSAENLDRLFASLIHPDRKMTAVDKCFAEHLMKI